MPDIIAIMLRAVRLWSLSSAYFSQLPPLSWTWQKVQFSPREAEKNPIVAMNSLTGIPLRTRTFLKTCSAICDLCSGRGCPPANATLSTHTAAVPTARRTDFDLDGIATDLSSGQVI